MKKIICLLTLTFFLISNIFSQSHNSTQSHQSEVSKIVPFMTTNGTEVAVLSSGEDGFLIRWTDDDQGEHYQVSDVGIKLIACSPNGNDVAFYETDGGSVNKVSVYDWRTFKRKYFKRYTDSITSLNFSAKGKYLMIGTASVDGVEFKSTNNWQTVDKVKVNTSIVNYTVTNESEKTCVMYSPSGSLTYYDLTTGKTKAKFSVVQGLSQTVMFNDFKFLAGVKDDKIYIIHAYKGNTISTIPASNPILLSSSNEKNLYYIEYDGKNNYEIKMLESIDERDEETSKVQLKVTNPRSVKNLRGPRGKSAITTGCKIYTNIYLGGGDGAIYKVESDASLSTDNMTQITENTYKKILDLASFDNEFLFLTNDSIFKSTYESGIPQKIGNSNGQKNISSYDQNNILLWSKGYKSPVTKINLNTKTEEVLFTPKSNIQSLNKFTVDGQDYLVEIESNSIVNIYDCNKQTLTQAYSGSGIQDAVICNDGKLYVGVSAAITNSPLVCVDLKTYETVPLSVKGNVTFGLSTNGKMIYGINLVTENSENISYVYSFNIESKAVTNILKFAEEDADAFTSLYGNYLFTNIGKNKLYCYNISGKKRITYNRSASIPVKATVVGKRVAILNNNGSISWATAENQQLNADWFLTNDNSWYEF